MQIGKYSILGVTRSFESAKQRRDGSPTSTKDRDLNVFSSSLAKSDFRALKNKKASGRIS
jgi:hypothetical protein